MKRKRTDVTPENLDTCEPISRAKTKKKKKKNKDDNIDADDSTNGCRTDEVSGAEKFEASESASEIKRKKKRKKVKKEEDANVDATESADLTDSCMNEEPVDRKAKEDRSKTEKDKMEEEVLEDEEELSPEERRVLERKLKKIQKKEKKKQTEVVTSEKEENKSSIAQTQALEYLTCWSENRTQWKFQKTRQVWLLQHMYDGEKVPDTHFSVLLSYLEGLQGVAREITTQKAEALVRFGVGPEGEEGGTTEAQNKTQRAREVIQILS